MTHVIARGSQGADDRWMTVLRVLPLAFSALVLAAHFYRGGDVALAAIVAASPLLLLAKRTWTVTALQIGLFVAAAEWIRTASSIASFRAAAGMPSTRMFVILGSVALFTALSAIPLSRLRQI